MTRELHGTFIQKWALLPSNTGEDNLISILVSEILAPCGADLASLTVLATQLSRDDDVTQDYYWIINISTLSISLSALPFRIRMRCEQSCYINKNERIMTSGSPFWHIVFRFELYCLFVCSMCQIKMILFYSQIDKCFVHVVVNVCYGQTKIKHSFISMLMNHVAVNKWFDFKLHFVVPFWGRAPWLRYNNLVSTTIHGQYLSKYLSILFVTRNINHGHNPKPLCNKSHWLLANKQTTKSNSEYNILKSRVPNTSRLFIQYNPYFLGITCFRQYI